MKRKKRIFTRLTLLTLVSALLIPMLNTVLVWPFCQVFSSDIAYAESVVFLNTIYGIYFVLDAVPVYLMAFCLAYSFYKRAERFKICFLVSLSLAAVYAMTAYVDINFGVDSVPEKLLLLNNSVVWLSEMVRLSIAAVLTLAIAKLIKKRSSDIFVILNAAIIFVSNIAVCVIGKVSLIYTISTVLCAILGYFICLGMLHLLERKKR